MGDATDVEQILTISSTESRGCPICKKKTLDGTMDFDGAVNHVIGHGWNLLHVGSQDVTGMKGEPYRTTVAVLGGDSVGNG